MCDIGRDYVIFCFNIDVNWFRLTSHYLIWFELCVFVLNIEVSLPFFKKILSDETLYHSVNIVTIIHNKRFSMHHFAFFSPKSYDS